MLIAAAIAALGGLISRAAISGSETPPAPRHPSPSQACTAGPPEVEEVEAASVAGTDQPLMGGPVNRSTFARRVRRVSSDDA